MIPQQVSNINKIGLNYKMLPNKTLASKKIISRFKLSKEQITLPRVRSQIFLTCNRKNEKTSSF